MELIHISVLPTPMNLKRLRALEPSGMNYVPIMISVWDIPLLSNSALSLPSTLFMSSAPNVFRFKFLKFVLCSMF
jgi:carbohydrate-binding DOMON domain-containing protein